MKKRLVAFLLVLIMVLGMLPVTALASFDAQEATLVDETEATTYARGPGYQPEAGTAIRTLRIKVYTGAGDTWPTLNKNDKNFPYTCDVQVNLPQGTHRLSSNPGTYVPELNGKKVKKYLVTNAGFSDAFQEYTPGRNGQFGTLTYLSAQLYMVIWLEGGQISEETQLFQYQVVYLNDSGKFTYDMESAVPVEYVCQNTVTNHKRNPNNGGHYIKHSDIKNAADLADYRKGYTLIGWSLNENGSKYSHTDFKSTDALYKSFANNQKIYFLAEKNPETYTFVLKYDPNGGTGGPDSDSWSTTDRIVGSHTFDIKADEPTREGFVFKGWKAQDGSSTIYHSDSAQGVTNCTVSQYGNDVVKSGNTWTRTLYAVWEPVSVTPVAPTYAEYKHTTVRIECVTKGVKHNDSFNAVAVDLASYTSKDTPNYTIGTEVQKGTLNGEERYYVDGEITNVTPFVNTFDGKYPGHTEASGHKLTFKLWYYPENIGSTEPGVHVWQADTVPTIYVKCPPVPTADNLNLKVDVKCVTDNSNHEHQLTDKLIADSFTVSEPDDDGYRTITIKAEKYLAEYAKKYPGITHTPDFTEKTAKVLWNKDTEMWVYFKRGVDANVITFNVTCESTSDEPTLANTDLQLIVKCVTNNAAHGEQPMALKEGTFQTGAVYDRVSFKECTITVATAEYVTAFDTGRPGTHTAKQTSLTITLYQNPTTGRWNNNQTPGTVDNVIEVTCESTGPNAPTAEKLNGMTIARVRCMTSNTNHADTPYAYIENTLLDTDEVENHEGTYTCTVWLEVAPYVAKYNEDNAPQVHSRQAADAARVPVTMVYDETNGWTVEQIGDHPAYADIKVYCETVSEQPIYVYFRPVNSNVYPDSNSLTLADETLERLHLTYNNGNKDWFTYGKLMSASTDINDVEDALETTAFTRHKDNEDFKYGSLISWAGELEWVNMGYHLGYDGENAAAYHLNGDLKFYWVKYDTNAGTDSGKVTGAPTNYYDGGIQDYYLVGETISKMPTLSRPGYKFLGWTVMVDGDASVLSLPETDEKTTVDVEGGEPYEFTQYGNITFVAQWEAEKYDIIYHSNYNVEGMKEEKRSSTAKTDEKVALKNISSTGFEKPGYTFAGWNTKADGTGTLFVKTGNANKVVFTAADIEDGKVHLYAQWTANGYTVKFDKNGGEGSMENQSFTYDVEQALTANAFTKTGYTFLGWNTKADGTGTGYEDGELVKNLTSDPDGVVTLYAQWKENSYTVKFDKNGDNVQGKMNSQKFTYDAEAKALTKNKYTRTGYTFTGWNTKADGTGTSYADEALVRNLTAEANGVVTLYAQWEANRYTVKFDKNSSSAAGTMAVQSFTYDEAAKTLSKNTFSRVGYTFAGWNTQADGKGTPYADEALVRNLTAEANGVVTLYAQWNINLYPFVFDSQGGSAVPTQTVAHGSTATKPADPTRSGYWFVGWYTDTTFTKLYDFSTPVTGPTTVYARWSMIIIPGTITKKNPKLNTYDHFAYVQGYPDGTVKPAGNITRAETAAILFRLMDNSSRKTYLSTKSGFRDVTAGSWYNTYVATLNNAGVITDSANGYFRPNEAITRAELAAMLASFTETTRAANYFDDVSANHWAAKAIAICAELGWITGYPDDSFRPDRNVTRAELMAMINRATGRAPKSADAFLPGMKTWSDNTADKWYYLDVQEATNSHSYAVSPTELWTALTAAPDWSRYE